LAGIAEKMKQSSTAAQSSYPSLRPISYSKPSSNTEHFVHECFVKRAKNQDVKLPCKIRAQDEQEDSETEEMREMMREKERLEQFIT